MLDLYVMWQERQRNSRQREKAVAVYVFVETYISPGFWFPRSILSANQAIIRKMLCSYDIDMAMTTVPRLGFAEGMPSMEVVKLWQSLPNEGHPMLLSLKTLEWINFFCVFCIFDIWYIYTSKPGTDIYILYFTLSHPWASAEILLKIPMEIPGRIGKIRHCKSWWARRKHPDSGIGCCLQSPLNNGPVISMRIFSSEHWKLIWYK